MKCLDFIREWHGRPWLALRASARQVGPLLSRMGRSARRSIAAGRRITMTRPIILDDCVIIENELGFSAKNIVTYVVVRIWGERGLVGPLNYFIEHPMANWMRVNPGLISTVLQWFDYGIPLQPLRQELQLIREKAPESDWKTCILQMCEAAEQPVKIRVLVSAVNLPAWWGLRCWVREGLMDFVQRQYPHYLPTMRARLLHAPEGAPLVSVS